MMQYYFDGPEVEVKLKPHGNSKSSMPFFRTSTSAKKLHRELASKSMPKDVVHQATQLQGGELEAWVIGSLPRNRQQIANYRRGENKKDENVLYSVMLECKQAQGRKHLFVTSRRHLIPNVFFVMIGNSLTWNVFGEYI